MYVMHNVLGKYHYEKLIRKEVVLIVILITYKYFYIFIGILFI
jgi:hypothetical protein